MILNEPMEVKATAFPSITYKQAWTIALHAHTKMLFGSANRPQASHNWRSHVKEGGDHNPDPQVLGP